MSARPPYEYFEHTADLGLRAWGADLAALFASAALGLVAIVVDPRTVKARESRVVELPGAELSELLVAWLNEILFLLDSEGFVAGTFEVSAVGPEGLRAEVRGEPLDQARHAPHGGIKAATYHLASVECGEDGCQAQVILDV
ncbi:MAG: archease [Chloroflexota bacterium]